MIGQQRYEAGLQALSDAGAHVRTTVGVYQLPKNAAVKVDLLAIAQ